MQTVSAQGEQRSRSPFGWKFDGADRRSREAVSDLQRSQKITIKRIRGAAVSVEQRIAPDPAVSGHQ